MKDLAQVLNGTVEGNTGTQLKRLLMGRARSSLQCVEGSHLKSNIQKLYINQKENRWDLVSARVSILDETQTIQVYISKMAPKDDLLR